MWLDPKPHVRSFLRFWEAIDLNNQTFMKASASDRVKKLDIALRQLTGDAMTKEQRQRLLYALGHRKQYRLQLCTTGCDFKQAVSLGLTKDCKGKRVRMLIENDCGMVAALVSSQLPGKRDTTVYLYLPEAKEAMLDALQE